MTEPSHEQKELSAVWAYMGDVGLTARFLERLLSLTRSGRMLIGEVALGPPLTALQTNCATSGIKTIQWHHLQHSQHAPNDSRIWTPSSHGP